MPFWSKKIDWEKSPAHHELLSMFLKQYQLKDLYQNEGWFSEWHRVLGESPKTAIGRYIENGYLVIAPLSNILDCFFKLTELKGMAKKYGIPASGKKADLISRLVAHDKEGFTLKVKGITDIYSCSELGRPIAENYKQFRKEEREFYENKTLVALRNKNISEAANLFVTYQKNQVFPSGVDANNIANLVDSIKFVFSANPEFLTEIKGKTLDDFRVAAGMNLLWMSGNSKNWFPEDFNWNHRLDIDTTCSMLNRYAYIQWRLNDIRRMDKRYVRSVEIHAADNCCSYCKKYKDKKFDLDHIPELPNPNCTNKLGCRCDFYPIWNV